MNTSQNQNKITLPINYETDLIASELQKKSKRTFRSKAALRKQARYFSPFYRDFIAKVISNNSLKVKRDSESYISQILKAGESYFGPNNPIVLDKNCVINFDKKLSKKREYRIHVNLDDLGALPHELGHYVDFMFGQVNALSNVVILSNGKTLNQIFTEEFDSKHEYLYQMVMDEYKNIINSNINEEAYDLLVSHMDEYRLLRSIPIDKDKEHQLMRKVLQDKLYKCRFVDTYCLMFERKCYQILNDKYSPILDALSSKYDFDGLNLSYHDKEYYEASRLRPTYEFFANAFGAKVSGKYQHIEHLNKLLPKSFEAFEELFDIAYKHIINNKRFIDIAIRQRRSPNEF